MGVRRGRNVEGGDLAAGHQFHKGPYSTALCPPLLTLAYYT